MDGTLRLMLSAFVPSGATRTLELKFWMVVSLPVFFPDSAEIAESFDPRLKLASVEFSSLTVPTVTNLSTGPEIVHVGREGATFQCCLGR